MFFFNRSRPSKYKDFSAIGIDMHSHLIPGVDDGAKDIDDSIELIRGLKELGFSHLITTPHTLQDIHPNTKQTLQQAHALLENHIPEGIKVDLSSEYYLDDQFQQQMTDNTLIPMSGNRILLEFSQISRPQQLEEAIFEIGIKGYQIVLAHPERYLFFHKNFNYFSRLKDMGLELQVNAMSLTKHYGENIKAVAEKLVEKDMIDFIGTDIHHVKHLSTLRQVPETKSFTRLADSGLLKNQQLL